MQIPMLENEAERLFAGVGLTPEQMADQSSSVPGAQAERRLMIAVMEDAILTYHRFVTQKDSAARKHFEEVARWIDSTDSTWLYSFERICEALDLEPDALRHALTAGASDSRRPSRLSRFRHIAGARHAIRHG